MILYNLKTDKAAAAYGKEQYIITKFDDELNVESSYLVTRTGCLCPQGHKDTCRHRKMLPLMIDRADSSWFYCFDDKQWYDPTGEAVIIHVYDPTTPVVDKMDRGAPAPDLTNEVPHPRQYVQSLTGALDHGTIKIIPEPTKLRRLR